MAQIPKNSESNQHQQGSTPSVSTKLPLHIQIGELLTREIRAGNLQDGERLKPERLMSKELGISVGTLRKALRHLEDNGMLERIHGSGNYIRNNPDVKSIYALFRLELVDGVGFPTATVLSLNKMNKPKQLASSSPQAKAYRIRRLRHLDGALAALEEIWLDAAYAEELSIDQISDSLYLFYKDALGLWISRIEDRVSVAELPKWAPENLNNLDRKTWGYVERFSHDQQNQLAEFSRTWFDPKTVHFVAR